MDTANNRAFSISPQNLGQRIRDGRAPLILDVCRTPRFAVNTHMLAGATRCAPENVPAYAAAHASGDVVVYCVHGHDVSQGAAAAMRAAGWNAQYLVGGMEGGEDGVDSPSDIASWRAAALPPSETVVPGWWGSQGEGSLRRYAQSMRTQALSSERHELPALPTVLKRPDLGVTGEQPSRWVTRARPKIDRIACPWLIRRYIDPRAEFFYVPTSQVFVEAKRLQATVYDIPGAPISHTGPHGELCTFDTLLHAFELRIPALDMLARIVRGADTDRLDLMPESAGLLAVSLGMSNLHTDDHAMVDAMMPVYDALYRSCARAINLDRESHHWKPESMQKQLQKTTQ